MNYEMSPGVVFFLLCKMVLNSVAEKGKRRNSEFSEA